MSVRFEAGNIDFQLPGSQGFKKVQKNDYLSTILNTSPQNNQQHKSNPQIHIWNTFIMHVLIIIQQKLEACSICRRVTRTQEGTIMRVLSFLFLTNLLCDPVHFSWQLKKTCVLSIGLEGSFGDLIREKQMLVSHTELCRECDSSILFSTLFHFLSNKSILSSLSWEPIVECTPIKNSFLFSSSKLL